MTHVVVFAVVVDVCICVCVCGWMTNGSAIASMINSKTISKDIFYFLCKKSLKLNIAQHKIQQKKILS